MTDVLSRLSTLHRPRLLIRAARHGLQDYNRNNDLRRILRAERVPGPQAVLPRLIDMEAEQETIRQAGDAAYSVARHVELLIAVMAEARLLGGGQAAA
jgi:plasmid stability protein